MRDDWLLLALGEVATRSTQKNSALLDRVLTVSAEHGLIEQELFFTKRVASKNLSGYSVVAPGVFVYNKSYSVKAPMGVIARNRDLQAGVVSPLYIIFQANEDKILLEFLEMATNSALFHTSLEGFIKEGGRAHGGITISLGDFFGAALLVPPLEEQRRIVDVVESVDNYIAALQARVDAARIARNAVLHELLNAGGDGWVETTLGEVCTFLNGYAFRSAEYVELGHHLIRIKNVQQGFLTLDDDVCVDLGDIRLQQFELADGDLVMSLTGNVGRVARCQRWHLPAALNQRVAKFWSSNTQLLHDDFLFLTADSEIFRGQVIGLGRGAAQQNVSTWDISQLEICLPPLVEQQRIVEIVSSMDDSIQATEQTIVEAKNLRSGLLSDLLSGEHEIPESYDKLLGAA